MTTTAEQSNSDSRSAIRAMAVRAIGLTALLALEFVVLIKAYRAQALPNAAFAHDWIEINALVMKSAFLFVNVGAVIAVALVLINWTQRRSLIAGWAEVSLSRPWLPWVVANLAIFAITLFGAFGLNAYLAQASEPPWFAFALWCAGAALLVPTLALAFAPTRYWTNLAISQRVTIVIAMAFAAIAAIIMQASERLWSVSADVTLVASAWVLGLYEHNVTHDVTTDVLSVADFGVLIGAPCSGVQGIGLVTTFLSLFIWAFRRDLKFPNALLIIPIAIVASWCLNVVRIVALSSIGAHFSRSVALGGFHDHAGWLMFLIAAVSLMFATYKIGFFRADAIPAQKTADPGIRLACAYVLPFVAIIAAGVLVKTFAQNPQPFYALTMTAALIAMWPFRDIYRKLIAKPQMVSILAGLVIGAGWIATNPGRGETGALGLWLASLPTWVAFAWICARVVGTSVLVPIAEELAFRGYLHRALIARRFESVAPGQFTWPAFLISTALFAIMHERWLSAAIAGAVYAVVMYRTGRISDAIVAHAASNVLIAAWAIIWGQWSLL